MISPLILPNQNTHFKNNLYSVCLALLLEADLVAETSCPVVCYVKSFARTHCNMDVLTPPDPNSIPLRRCFETSICIHVGNITRQGFPHLHHFHIVALNNVDPEGQGGLARFPRRHSGTILRKRMTFNLSSNNVARNQTDQPTRNRFTRKETLKVRGLLFYATIGVSQKEPYTTGGGLWVWRILRISQRPARPFTAFLDN